MIHVGSERDVSLVRKSITDVFYVINLTPPLVHKDVAWATAFLRNRDHLACFTHYLPPGNTSLLSDQQVYGKRCEPVFSRIITAGNVQQAGCHVFVSGCL